jgi:hypothetical protein
MQGHHRARERLRPRHRPTAVHARGDWQDQANGRPARLFLCRGCRVQVLICSHCDRGHVYCAEACAQKARRQSQRESGRRYQMSRRGRINHAARARRYRARKNNVTHQGSAPDRSDDLLREDQAVAMAERAGQLQPTAMALPSVRPSLFTARAPRFSAALPRSVEQSKKT